MGTWGTGTRGCTCQPDCYCDHPNLCWCDDLGREDPDPTRGMDEDEERARANRCR